MLAKIQYFMHFFGLEYKIYTFGDIIKNSKPEIVLSM